MSTESGFPRVVGFEVDEAELDAGCSAELEQDQMGCTVWMRPGSAARPDQGSIFSTSVHRVEIITTRT